MSAAEDSAPTELDDVAEARHALDPDGIAQLGMAVAHAIDPAAPAAESAPAGIEEVAHRIAAALMAAVVVATEVVGSEV